jgi:2-keto-3-deoxy-L-rhamnonate aldolase RhmA
MKELSIGSWITLNHFSIVEIMAGAGFDWLCVDMEHSVIDYNDAQKLIATIQAKGLEAYVRVGENNTRIIKRVLDAGADGIIVPMVNSASEAKKAIQSVKYPPVGKRGVGLARAQNYGLDEGFPKYRDGKAKEIKLIVQIEHINAIDELEEILQLDGIDGTFIGPYDLSGSMGKPGQYHDEDVKLALERYTKIASTFDKLMGFHVIEPDNTTFMKRVNEGYNFLAFSLDTLFLGTLCNQEMNKIRKQLDQG